MVRTPVKPAEAVLWAEQLTNTTQKTVIAEDSEPIQTQQLLGSYTLKDGLTPQSLLAGSSNRSPPASSVKKSAEKPRFADFTVSHWAVAIFIRRCVSSVVPVALLGNSANWNVIHTGKVSLPAGGIGLGTSDSLTSTYAAIEKFIGLRRHETMSIDQIVEGLRISQIAWLDLPGQRRKTVTDSSLRKELVHTFVLWLFNDYITDLIRVSSQESSE